MVVFSLYDGEELLFSANAVNFDRSAPFTLQQPLSPGESKTLTLAVEISRLSRFLPQGCITIRF